MKLRDYQQEAVDAVFAYWERAPSTPEKPASPLVVMPTGSGKSPTLGETTRRLVQDFGCRVVIATHRAELIVQDAKAVRSIWPMAPLGIYSAGLNRKEIEQITICGVQSIVRSTSRLGHVDVVIIDEAHDPADLHPFKGNIDLDKLQALIDKVGAASIPYVSLAGTVNMAGGQPVSMENVRQVRQLCDRYGIRIYLDATRMYENAFFIQEREPGYQGKSIAEILKEFCSYTDGAWMSAKKDNLVNIGGWLAVRDTELFDNLRNLVVIYEGLHTYGGMAGRDMEALAIGIAEGVQDDQVRARVGQVRYLGELLTDWEIPIVQPVGGHAIFLDARRFYPHIPQSQFPAQTLAAMLYLDSGVRSMERGVVSAGRDPQTGDHRYPKLELTRLTIPRRVYTQAHMDVVAESVKAAYDQRQQTRGLVMVYEPKYLRFFQARFEPAKG